MITVPPKALPPAAAELRPRGLGERRRVPLRIDADVSLALAELCFGDHRAVNTHVIELIEDAASSKVPYVLPPAREHYASEKVQGSLRLPPTTYDRLAELVADQDPALKPSINMVICALIREDLERRGRL